MLAPAKQLEIGEPVAAARDDLAVDEAVTGREGLNRRNDGREAMRPIDPIPRHEPDALAIAKGKHPIAIMFNLVQPIGSGRREPREGR